MRSGHRTDPTRVPGPSEMGIKSILRKMEVSEGFLKTGYNDQICF